MPVLCVQDVLKQVVCHLMTLSISSSLAPAKPWAYPEGNANQVGRFAEPQLKARQTLNQRVVSFQSISMAVLANEKRWCME